MSCYSSHGTLSIIWNKLHGTHQANNSKMKLSKTNVLEISSYKSTGLMKSSNEIRSFLVNIRLTNPSSPVLVAETYLSRVAWLPINIVIPVAGPPGELEEDAAKGTGHSPSFVFLSSLSSLLRVAWRMRSFSLFNFEGSERQRSWIYRGEGPPLAHGVVEPCWIPHHSKPNEK